jgi:putative ABC transport system permease protein
MFEEKHTGEPPRFWIKLLRVFCRRDLLEELEGDLNELYKQELLVSRSKANRMIRIEVLRLIRPRLLKKLKTQNIRIMLLANYFKMAFRNALHYKSYAVINLLGLIIGISSSLMIALWVADESTKDQFHGNGDRLYSVKRNMQESIGVVQTSSWIPNPLAQVLREEYPEIKQVVEVSWEMDRKVSKENLHINEIGRVVSSNFFEVFSFELLQGDASEVLSDPKNIVISRRLADKLVTAPGIVSYHQLIGQVIELDDEDEYQISGVYENPSERSSMLFDWLINKDGFVAKNSWVNSWENGSLSIHFEIFNHDDVPIIADRIEMEIENHTDRVNGERLWIQKFEEVYLNSNYENGQAVGGRIIYVRLMSIVAFLLIVVASINYMNLSTARSSRRSKEIGLRKVMGAYRNMISRQFVLESVIYSTVAFTISIGVVFLLIPFFNQLVNKDLYYLFSSVWLWIILVVSMVIVGILAGSYPALRLSTISILSSLRGEVSPHSKAFKRKGLFTLQMMISFTLLFGAWVIFKQLSFMLNSEIGIKKDGILAVTLGGSAQESFGTIKEEMLAIPGITAITAASGNPIDYGRSTSTAKWEGQLPNTPYEINVLGVADGFIEQMGMHIVAGRDFEPDKFGSEEIHFLINETAVDIMQFNDPIDKKLSIWGYEGKVIGVVKDYHMSTFHTSIPPLIVYYDPVRVNIALVKASGDYGSIINGIEELFQQFNPGEMLDYSFLDQSHADMYQNEITLGKLSIFFVLISIVIALLGLHGLTAYTSEKRTKEIGIRRVHGATELQLLLLLIREYALIILLSFGLAIPLGYLVSSNWLDQFVYRIDLRLSYFFIPGLILFTAGILTVVLKSFQVSRRNTISSLRSE